MKILLIAGSRVGGTKIGEWIGYELGLTYIHEPFGIWRDTNENPIWDIRNGNVIVKSHSGKELERLKGLGIHWDKTIGLIREDENDCAISMVWAEENGEWHKEYGITNEWISKHQNQIERVKDRIRVWRESILNNTDIELQITYKGIYNTKADMEKLKGYLGINESKYENLLDIKNRYRKDKPIEIKKGLI